MTHNPAYAHETALLTVSRWQRTAPPKPTVPDIAAALWDERDETGRLRDLEPHEARFLAVVREIGQDYVRVVGEANRAFGPESKTALAVEFTARARREERYAGALGAYESQKEAFWNATE